MTPLRHAKNDVKRHGGVVEDYLPIHFWFDSTKLHVPDLRHRVILHNSFGVGLCEQVFGPYITNSDGKRVATRVIAERHVCEDIGFIPTLAQALERTPITQQVAPLLRRLIIKETPDATSIQDAPDRTTEGDGHDEPAEGSAHAPLPSGV